MRRFLSNYFDLLLNTHAIVSYYRIVLQTVVGLRSDRCDRDAAGERRRAIADDVSGDASSVTLRQITRKAKQAPAQTMSFPLRFHRTQRNNV